MVAVHTKMAEQYPIMEAAFHAITYHVLETTAKHKSGDAHEKEDVLAILMSLKPDVLQFGLPVPEDDKSQYDRMGAEETIRPMCNELYNSHATNLITAPWFPSTSKWNQRTVDEVKENVFTFFSSGIGGPYEYKGQDMVAAHANMRDMNPITEAAFHAIVVHVIMVTKKHNAEGKREMDEVWGILMSLKPAVIALFSVQETRACF
jgi:hemoglobin